MVVNKEPKLPYPLILTGSAIIIRYHKYASVASGSHNENTAQSGLFGSRLEPALVVLYRSSLVHHRCIHTDPQSVTVEYVNTFNVVGTGHGGHVHRDVHPRTPTGGGTHPPGMPRYPYMTD